MNLISIIIALVILGVVLYCLNLIPMDDTVKKIINILAILFIVLWVLQEVGLLGNFGNVRLR